MSTSRRVRDASRDVLRACLVTGPFLRPPTHYLKTMVLQSFIYSLYQRAERGATSHE